MQAASPGSENRCFHWPSSCLCCQRHASKHRQRHLFSSAGLVDAKQESTSELQPSSVLDSVPTDCSKAHEPRKSSICDRVNAPLLASVPPRVLDKGECTHLACHSERHATNSDTEPPHYYELSDVLIPAKQSGSVGTMAQTCVNQYHCYRQPTSSGNSTTTTTAASSITTTKSADCPRKCCYITKSECDLQSLDDSDRHKRQLRLDIHHPPTSNMVRDPFQSLNSLTLCTQHSTEHDSIRLLFFN